jgi:capsular polysaccharide biosynthesis protein
VDAADLLGHFESLGDNCEFGILQRRAGLEPLGFFRLNFARMPALIRALDSDFADVGRPDLLEIVAAKNGEMIARIREFDFAYHTGKRIEDITAEALHAQQARAVPFLLRKLREDLRAADKIFVRKGNDSARLDAILPLLRALRRHGPVTLLWVVPHDAQHPPGCVEVLQPGLLKGYIDRLAEYHDAMNVSPNWTDICLGAYGLLHGDSPPGSRVRLPGPRLQPRLASRGGEFSAVPTARYRAATLADLAAAGKRPGGHPAVEALDYLPPFVLEIPALRYGDTDLTRPDIAVQPPVQGAGAMRVEQPARPAYLLRDALVHGKHGVVTIADRVVAETLDHLPPNGPAGAGWDEDGGCRLPRRPLAATIHSAFHLLAGSLGNYHHWLNDVLGRFSPDAFELLRGHASAAPAPIVVTPELDVFWKWESLPLALPPRLPRIGLAADGQTLVRHLLFAPNLVGESHAPHPALLEMFDRMRIAALGMPPAGWRPWRKLFVSRADSRNRVLMNEAELAARAEAAGFTRVVLGDTPVAEQIRLFAEALRVIAPHGAGLANLGFCRPGVAVCELHMDAHVHWAFRRLAAARGLRYGCLIGTAIPPRHDTPDKNTWRLDPARLDAVLADPAFMDG